MRRKPKKKTGAKAQGTPDGPYYRVQVHVPNSEEAWTNALSLDEARMALVHSRARGHKPRFHVTNDLGRTWEDCGDDGTPVSDPDALVVRQIG